MALADENKAELVMSLAALALSDGEAEVTADNLTALAGACGHTDIPAFWATITASAIEKAGGVDDFLGAPGAAAAVGAAGAGAAAGGAEAAAAVEEEEEEEEEEIDLGGGGMDMFGDEGGDY